MTEAACSDHDPLWWDTDHPRLWRHAIPICRACPVRVDCLRYGHGNPLASGVYGGIPLTNGTPNPTT
jgi:hypothetical protein